MQNNPVGKTSLGLEGNLAGLLCYILTPCCFIGAILALIVFFTEKENRFARFHALQSLLMGGVFVVIGFVIGFLTRFLMVAGSEFMALGLQGVRLLVYLVFLGICVFVGIQAYQNKMFKLPVLGDMAEKWSNG